MRHGRKALRIGLLLAASFAFEPLAASTQQADNASCGERGTEQLRRFNDKCMAELMSYVTSQPDVSAKIFGESQKFYVTLTRTGDRIDAEAVSKHNFPLMKDGVENSLKQLGWTPPENESANFRKQFSRDQLASGAVAEEVAKALAAYGLAKGEAISLTVGPKV